MAIIPGRVTEAAEVDLPLQWDRAYRRQNGRASVSFEFPGPEDSAAESEPYAILVMRIGSAYTVTLNGERLASYGDLERHYEARAPKQPLRVSFPASLLAERNLLVVEIRGDHLRNSGLSSVMLGPASAIDPIYSRAFVFRVIVPSGCSILSMLVSAFCLLLWLQHRDLLYGWAAVGEAIWSVIVLDTAWTIVPLHWQSWSVILVSLRAIWVWCLYAILERVCGPHPPGERITMKVLVFSGPVTALLGIVVGSSEFVELWRPVLSVYFIFMLVRILRDRSRSRALEAYLLLGAIFILILAGVHDGLAERSVRAIYSSAEWAKYAGSLLALTVMWIVNKQFREARRDAIEMQSVLAARVEARERELSDTYARMSELERSRAVTAERERILRDMHDGVGANLATAMRQLESGTAPNAAVAATLRESLDHLKLSIDAMNLPVGDVTSLLASLRYRLQPRIESAGLRFEWGVDLLPPWSAATDQSMRYLQFLLLEAISNALQHSNAHTLTLTASGDDDEIEIVLRDDGDGISEQAARNLQSMRERARVIGAELGIESAQPGTLVRVRLRRARTPVSD